MRKNWKSTLAGVAALLGIASKIVMAGTVDFATDGPMVMAAIGLLFSKDHNVTGGTVTQ